MPDNLRRMDSVLPSADAAFLASVLKGVALPEEIRLNDERIIPADRLPVLLDKLPRMGVSFALQDLLILDTALSSYIRLFPKPPVRAVRLREAVRRNLVDFFDVDFD